MKPARLHDVLIHGIHPIDVVPPLPVEEDVPCPCATTGVQPPAPRRDKFLQTAHQVGIPLEPRVGDIAVNRLNEVVAHLGVTLRMTPVKGLGKIRVVTHCWTVAQQDDEGS